MAVRSAWACSLDQATKSSARRVLACGMTFSEGSAYCPYFTSNTRRPKAARRSRLGPLFLQLQLVFAADPVVRDAVHHLADQMDAEPAGMTLVEGQGRIR